METAAVNNSGNYVVASNASTEIRQVKSGERGRARSGALRLRTLVALLIALCASASAWAQGTRPATPPVDITKSAFTTEGREFWVVFQKNFRDFITEDKTNAQSPAAPLELELFITSSKNAKGYVEIRGLGFRKEFNVPAGEVKNMVIDTGAQVRTSEKIEDLAVHIVSDEPIAVYGLDRRYQTTDTYLAYPVNVLGRSYRAIGYRWLQNDLLSQLAIIATENNTRVTVTPSVKTLRGRPANVPFDITLNRGDVYQIIPRYEPTSSSDLTGTLIESDKPVAVFSGHNCAYVPDIKTKACNLLIEQLPSLQSWGRRFFVGTLAGRSSSVFRVLATEDSTQVFENNSLAVTLQAGEFYENRNQTQHTMITATKPVLVAQYSKGFDNGDNVGDPMMIIVAPTEQFLASYRFATPVRGSWHHYINVIAPTNVINSMRLDGNPIPSTLFEPLGLSRYSIAQIEVRYGTHVIDAPEPFGLYSYGFGYDDAAYDAYGNGGGQSMEVVVELPDTMDPILDSRTGHTGMAITAIARDDRINDRGLEQIQIIDSDNLSVNVARFEPGAPVVPITLTPQSPRQNGYAVFRLRDRVGNSSYYTICMRYDEIGDSAQISVLPDGRSCDFAGNLLLGGFIKYSVTDNNVLTTLDQSIIDPPVTLKGSTGVPMWGIGGYGEYPYSSSLFLTGHVALDFFGASAFGYPDSLAERATDGRSIVEEFELRHTAVILSLSPGIQYYFAPRRAYLFGSLNLGFPLFSSETLTRRILSPSNYVYENNEGSKTVYEDGGPGMSILITPEFGIGASVDLEQGWRAFAELGAGFSLTSVMADRGWTLSYLFGRFGAKVRF